MCIIQVKNYHLFYTTVLEYNRSLWLETRQGQGTGLYCYDAFLQKHVTWYMRIAWLLEDVRGMPNPTGSKQAPAVIGACALCGIRGTRLPGEKDDTEAKGTTFYPGAICHCNDEVLKDAFKKEFNKFTAALNNTYLNPRPTNPNNTTSKPSKMTTAKAYAAAKAVESKQQPAQKKDEAKVQPFKQYSAFHDFFPDSWDMLSRMMFDCGHEFSNLGLDMLALINNKDKMKWTGHRKTAHKKMGRFKVNGYSYMTEDHDRPKKLIYVYILCVCV